MHLTSFLALFVNFLFLLSEEILDNLLSLAALIFNSLPPRTSFTAWAKSSIFSSWPPMFANW